MARPRKKSLWQRAVTRFTRDKKKGKKDSKSTRVRKRLGAGPGPERPIFIAANAKYEKLVVTDGIFVADLYRATAAVVQYQRAIKKMVNDGTPGPYNHQEELQELKRDKVVQRLDLDDYDRIVANVTRMMGAVPASKLRALLPAALEAAKRLRDSGRESKKVVEFLDDLAKFIETVPDYDIFPAFLLVESVPKDSTPAEKKESSGLWVRIKKYTVYRCRAVITKAGNDKQHA
ncbi:hypothetical protein PVAG01_07319 [Phlyctema vagabunda]|uniref:Uncharacterized protein n=1 Tax=Phlyctema vagabunda TaxID=108571 RepID=A0ABR4PC46_9HELO